MTTTARTTFLGGVTVERDVPVPMRDGVVLRADVYRPELPGPHPVLLIRVPYDKTAAQTIVYRHPAWYARKGYVVVAQDVRGRFASEGEFYPLRNEAVDGFDTIAWAARLPGTTGRVGMYGFSYPGAVQLLAATLQPPGLGCIVPGFTGSDYFDGWTYKGGAFQQAFMISWVVQWLAQGDALKRGRRDIAEKIEGLARRGEIASLYAFEPLKQLEILRESGSEYFFDWLEHDSWDEYWQAISLQRRYDAIRVPALHVVGWYDSFIEGVLKNYSALTELAGDDATRTQRLVVGPWVHIPWARVNGTRNFGEDADNLVDDLQSEWFDYWLKDSPNGALDGPPVRLFVMGENRWRSADRWPPSTVRVEDWYLHASRGAVSLSGDGSLSQESPGDEPPDIFVYAPYAPVPSAGGNSCCDAELAPMGPFEQSYVEIRNDVLVYSTRPLEHDLDVIGPVDLILYAATDAIDTDWTAKLVDVDEAGRAFNLCDGILRARFRESLERPTPIEPGRVYEYRIRVGSTANRFYRGHRLRLEISSSNWPNYDLNTNTGARVGEGRLLDAKTATQVVFHDASRASRLLLPIVRP